jgi:hypothetical protein
MPEVWALVNEEGDRTTRRRVALREKCGRIVNLDVRSRGYIMYKKGKSK